MNILRSRFFRIVLLSILVAGVLAILWSFIMRRQQIVDALGGVLLSPDVAQQSTEFEYTQLKQGRPVFRVVARTSVLTQANVHTLEDVRLTRFDPEGDPADRVEGDRAIYRIDEKQIHFEGNVVIQLSDGIRVLADKVQADLAKEVITINQNFRFYEDLLTGTGRGLLYNAPDRRLLVRNGLELSFPTAQGEGFARANSAVYDLETGTIELAGQSRIQTTAHQLTGEKIAISTGSDRSIQHVRSVGNARLVNLDTKIFRGDQIDLVLKGGGRSLDRFEVLGDRTGAQNQSTRRAVYEERVREGIHRLEALRIQGILTADPEDSQSVKMDSLKARGEVQLMSSVLQIEESDAEQLDIQFEESSSLMQQIDLTGGVMIARRSTRFDRPSREVLRSNQLSIFLEENRLDRASARDNIDVEITAPPLHRHLSARDTLDLTYENGVLTRALAKGNCLLETLDGQGQSSVRSPVIESVFESGAVDQVTAGKGVEVEVFRGDVTRHTRSQQLYLDYENGLLVRAVQSGDFEMFERSPAQIIEAWGERAEYEPRSEQIEISGKDRPVLNVSGVSQAEADKTAHTSRTVADRFILNRATGSFEAMGRVETVIDQPQNAVIITASTAFMDPTSGWITYTENARLVQGPNIIRGSLLRFHRLTEELQVEGGVESVLTQTGETEQEERQYQVKSETLRLNREEAAAVYEGDVEVSSEDLDLKASRVVFHFKNQDVEELDRIVATGGVEIREQGRTWNGARAVYYAADERVVILGDEADGAS